MLTLWAKPISRVVGRRYSSTLRPNDLILTDSAKKRLRTLLKSTPSYLRLTVDPGGCSGFLAKFSVENTPLEADDLILDENGAKLVVDKISLGLTQGSTIDYVNEIARQAFVISENPNASSNCGCHVSFGIE